MKRINLTRIAATLGYSSVFRFLLRFALPVVGGTLLCSALLALFDFPLLGTLLPMLAGIGFVLLYPSAIFLNQKSQIEGNLHLFITYAGTISTMQINRTILFKRIANKQVFGEISHIAQKIHYLAKRWTLGFAKTCRKVGGLISSQAFADFLDRFAVAMDFGQNIEAFLLEEQDAMMGAYELEYKKSLESIKMLQNLFISLTVSVAFMLSISLLLPILMGISLEVIVKYAIFAILVVDGFIILFVKALVPSDKICHNLKIKNKGRRQLEKSLLIVVPSCLALVLIIFLIADLPFLVTIAIGATPLVIPGFLAKREEKLVLRRESFFPSFVRTLGSAIRARNGAVLSSLKIILVHDFGLVNDMMHGLYRRLKLGCDKIESWVHYAGESGSHLIHLFSKIFSESVYLGGDGEKVGQIVSANFQRLISLRALRLQLASGLRGALYGSLIGFSSAIYVTSKISQTLSDIFSGPLQNDGALSGFISSITPGVVSVDMTRVSMFIGVLIFVHSVVSAFIMKLVDGGLLSAACIDLVAMLWLGALLSWFIPALTDSIMPNLGTAFEVAGAGDVGLT